MTKEQLKGDFLGQDSDLNGVKPAQLAAACGEEDVAAKGEQSRLATDRPGQQCRILNVVQDEQGVSSVVEFLERDLKLTLGRLRPNFGTKPAA